MIESDVRLPSRFFADLSRRCGRAGPEAAGALREAGRALGGQLVEELPRREHPDRASPDAFWEIAAEVLSEHGLGDLDMEVKTPSVAELRLRGGPEAAGEGEESPAGGACPLATGIVAGVLTAAADEPVAVLEVACAADGDEACRWLAGSRETLEGVRGALREGASVREALEAS